MKEECLICKAPLEYLEENILMECAICHKKENSKTHCINDHYVCTECHTSGVDSILAVCLQETSRNPIEIIEKMMSMEFCHMHGPEHHVMVGAALLTAFKNAGGEIDLSKALLEMHNRGKEVPGGVCGFWGACGAGISTGIYMSILNKATPLAKEAWGMSNQMTAKALAKIGENGGPRCCKRDSYLAITEAVKFTEEKLGIKMELDKITCSRSSMNNQCIGEACPFNSLNEVFIIGRLDRSFVYKKFKYVLIESYGKEKAKTIWNASNIELERLLKEYTNIGSDEKMMILPLSALYTTLKKYEINEPLFLLKEYGKQTGDRISRMIRIVTSVPGVSKLLWANMPKLMRKTSSPQKGYARRIVSETSELVGVDILVCPLHEMAKRLGVPELATVVCLIDKGQMTGFKNIDYTRTKSLGDGDEFCDYRLKYKWKN